MKVLFIIICGLLTIGVGYAQTVEEKIAIKACECLELVKAATNDTIRDCVVKSVISGMDEYKTEMPKDFYTVEGMRRVTGAVADLLPQTCRSVKQKKYEIKKEKFYSDSEIALANDYFKKSTELMLEKRYDLAIDGFKRAIEFDSMFVKAYDHLAVCYRSQANYENAIKFYNASLNIFPEGDLALMNLAVVYTLKNDPDKALFFYDKLVKSCPENPEGYFGAGKILFLKNDYEKALNNVFAAHIMYVNSKSDYIADSAKLIRIIYAKMKEDKQLPLFKKIAKAYNININD